jgi:hypothetical protein
MANTKTVLQKMIAAMNRGETVWKPETEVFVKPRPKKKRVVKKSPPPVRKARNSKARKKPRKKKPSR